MQEAFDLWINPELERRHAAGQLPADFVLMVAQVLFDPTDGVSVRLNEEVRV